jgi:predicted transcriptional regulator
LTIGLLRQILAACRFVWTDAQLSLLTRPYLGDLELAVLDALWGQGGRDAKSLHADVGVRRGISLNTVQSTLERLFRKGLLRREKVSHAYVYTPALERRALMVRLIGDLVETLSDGRPEPMLGAFVDLAAQVDADNLARLERLLAERLDAQRGCQSPEVVP